MVGAGNVQSLLWTFLRLRKTCKQALMNIFCDSYADLTVNMKVTFAEQANQAPKRGPAVQQTGEGP